MRSPRFARDDVCEVRGDANVEDGVGFVGDDVNVSSLDHNSFSASS